MPFIILHHVRRKLLLVFNLLVILWTLLAILGMNVPPHHFWPAGFLAFSLPVPLALNLLCLLVWLLYRPALVIILAWGFHTRILALNLRLNSLPEIASNSFRVMSYNARIFNRYAFERREDRVQSRHIIDWVAHHPADIFCVQEYYNQNKSTIYNATSKIGREPKRHIFLSRTFVNSGGAKFAMAIYFNTYRDVTYPDHFPNSAVYSFKPLKE